MDAIYGAGIDAGRVLCPLATSILPRLRESPSTPSRNAWPLGALAVLAVVEGISASPLLFLISGTRDC
jgi:hypothetical protein